MANDDAIVTDQKPIDERFPIEPPITSVLRFERKLGERTYTYVAFRATKDVWYYIGRRASPTPMNWSSVRSMIEDDAVCQIATDWFDVPMVFDPHVNMTPAEFVGQAYPKGELP